LDKNNLRLDTRLKEKKECLKVLATRARDHKTKAGDQSQISRIRLAEMVTGLQSQLYDLGPRLKTILDMIRQQEFLAEPFQYSLDFYSISLTLLFIV
jgi:hypothetical protein